MIASELPAKTRWNENGLLDSPDAPLEQVYLLYKGVANAGEGWESNWAAKIQHRHSNMGAKF